MILRGIVSEINGDKVLVALESAPCEGCRTPCAACVQTGKPRFASVPNTVGARVGDPVRLECKDKSVLLSGVLLFLFPLVAGIVAVLCTLFLGEATAALIGAAALAICFVLATIVLSFYRRKSGNALTLLPLRSDPPEDENSLDKR